MAIRALASLLVSACLGSACLIAVACASEPGGHNGHAGSASSAGGSTGVGDSTGVGGGGGQDGQGGGAQGSGSDSYVAGLAKEGTSHVYRFVLVESAPIPKYTGPYTWTVKLTDLDGNATSGASLVAEPRMELHAHGTSPPLFDATPTGEPGTYTLGGMDLFMPGVWTVYLRVMEGDALKDEVAFRFDLEG